MGCQQSAQTRIHPAEQPLKHEPVLHSASHHIDQNQCVGVVGLETLQTQASDSPEWTEPAHPVSQLCNTRRAVNSSVFDHCKTVTNDAFTLLVGCHAMEPINDVSVEGGSVGSVDGPLHPHSIPQHGDDRHDYEESRYSVAKTASSSLLKNSLLSEETEVAVARSSRPIVSVVDDSAVLRKQICRHLRDVAGEVHTFPSGAEFVGHVTSRSTAYDANLILMDYDMPQTNGAEATRALRALCIRAPIVVITGNHEVEEQCLAAGANRVLYKPVSRSQVEEIVQSYSPIASPVRDCRAATFKRSKLSNLRDSHARTQSLYDAQVPTTV